MVPRAESTQETTTRLLPKNVDNPKSFALSRMDKSGLGGI